jgi:EAL domain-containing protein (putative c-di-GMP-specific phosphodiesterase class I)
VNLGIATGSGTSLLTKAKLALRESKEYKRGSYKFFDSHSKFILQQQDNIYWTQKIKDSIESGNIVPYYQPIHNNITKKIHKYECLARIEDDGLIIAPSRFMPSAKLTGMLPFITRTMIEQSFKHFSGEDIEFSINVTNDDFYLDYLQEYLLKYALKYNINPSNVILEILEDIASLNQSNTLVQLYALRKKGFKIAIDDFGSESSNLSRLLEFSPDYLKIDGSFIKNILEDEKSLIIVEAIVLIAKRSKIKIIAEYVHSKEVQEKVEELGIEYSQGYYFSEPRRDTHSVFNN